MSLLHGDLLSLVRELKQQLKEEYDLHDLPPPTHVPLTAALSPSKETPQVVFSKASLPEEPISAPLLPETEPSPPSEKFLHLRKWAKGLFSAVEPISPIICLGHDPLLIKLADALSQKVLPATCHHELPSLQHPLLKLLLIPLPLVQKIPSLKHLAHHPPHHFIAPILLLHPLDVYTQHPHEKRLLWNLILKLPLLS